MSRRRPAPVVEAEPVAVELPVLPPPKRKNRPKVGKALRAEVFARDKHRCVYCGRSDNLTVDHKKPLAKGGKNVKSNMVTACKSCNGDKADGPAPPMRGRRKS